MGSVPDWYALGPAAKWLNCSVMELAERIERGEEMWFLWGHCASNAEASAQKQINERKS